MSNERGVRPRVIRSAFSRAPSSADDRAASAFALCLDLTSSPPNTGDKLRSSNGLRRLRLLHPLVRRLVPWVTAPHGDESVPVPTADVAPICASSMYHAQPAVAVHLPAIRVPAQRYSHEKPRGYHGPSSRAFSIAS